VAEAKLRPDIGSGLGHVRVAKEETVPWCGGSRPEATPEQRRLARPIRPEDGRDRAGPDRKADLAQHHVPVVSGLKVAQFPHGRYLAIFGRRSSAPISSVPRQAARTSSLEMADEDLVLSEVDADGVATVTLNRPERRNAWTAAMEVR
jgi:hypothetical protein